MGSEKGVGPAYPKSDKYLATSPGQGLQGNHRNLHAMSVDVEDWLNATILQETGKIYPPSEAVVRNSELLMAIFEAHHTQATWFFLGEVAEAFPGLVRQVAAAGNEIGVHGFHHHQVGCLTPAEFKEAITRAKNTLEQTAGVVVTGYRAVDFSINQETPWALDILLEAGFKYDASLFPMRLPRYGATNARTEPHWIPTASGGWIYEIPVTVCQLPWFRLPFAGGGYFRLFPFWFIFLLMQWETKRRQAVFYLHPCEVEEESSLDSLPKGLTSAEISKIRQRFRVETRGRHNGWKKLGRLLEAYRFGSIAEAFDICELVPPKEVK
jgi:polysaccharide deacetylase family protein (PEP-CTERM system associated)